MKYKTSDLPIEPNKNHVGKRGFNDKRDYELIIDGDSIYEIDKECIECLQRQKSKELN